MKIIRFIKRIISSLIFKRKHFSPPKDYYGARHTTKDLYPVIFELLSSDKIKFIDSEVDLNWFIPDYKYEFRREVFELWDKRQSINFKKEVKKTRLYKQKGMGKILEICNLLESVRNNNYRNKHSKGKLPPCFLEMPSLSVRIDGTNRGSILRYLGHKTIKVKKILAKDFFTCNIPVATRTDLLKLWYKNYASKKNLPVNVPDNIFGGEKERSGWYQDIELVPGIWTKEPKIEQTNLVRKHMPDLSSRKVLDVGCCTGIYSFLAAERKAAKVCGIDIEKLHIKRANFVKTIWSQGTSLYNSVEFKCLDILENLSMIEDFDTLIVCNTLYLLGPDVHDFMKVVENSNIDLLFLQGQLERESRIGELNHPGVRGYEKGDKTWGNILATPEGLKKIIKKYNFRIEKIIDSRKWPLYIVRR